MSTDEGSESSWEGFVDGPFFPDVTQRFEEGVTERLPDAPPPSETGSVTEVLPSAPGAPRIALTAGELVADRFRVEEGPLGAPTGEADVFRCLDTQTGEAVAVKFYHEKIAPKTTVLDNLVKVYHPNVVTLRTYGAWAGRFFEVMDYCAGGCLIDFIPLKEADIESRISDIVTGLHYLHGQGIIHRDIKPSNLFFRDRQSRVVVIGDFGVSSLLERDEKVRKTSTASFFTLDYAAPELIDGKEVSPKTDYYALGITLIHLIMGKSPFAGKDKNTILGCHFRGTTPRPERVSKRLRQLIDGLVRIAPDRRWGYGQVMSWLNHETVMTDEGVRDREDAYGGKRFPYRSLPEVVTPRDLARRLDDFDIERDLERGAVSQWLMFFDTDLGRRVAQVEEEFEGNPELAVLKLRHLLDPDQPFQVGEREVHSVAQLVQLLASSRHAYSKEFQNLLYSERIEAWVSTLQPAETAAELASKIAELRQRVPNKIVGVFSLLYLLDAGRPLALSDHVALARPEQLEAVLVSHPEVVTRVAQYLFTGQFEEWLRGCFPERADDIRFVAKCVETYKDNRDLGLFAVRCRFQPTLPLKVGVDVAATPKQLAAVIDRNRESWARGIRLLANGWIRTWLTATGQLRNADAFDELVNDFTISWARKMEGVLHLLDPALPWPAPAADIEAIEAGGVSKESVRTYRVSIFNAGRGHLSGVVTLADVDRGCLMHPKAIEGDPVEVKVIIECQSLPVGSRQETRILVDTNAGRLEIPISFRVTAPIKGMLFRSLLAGLLVGELFGVYRLALQELMPQYNFTLLHWFQWDYIRDHLDQWGFIPAAALLAGAIAAGVYHGVLFYRAHAFVTAEEPEDPLGFSEKDAVPNTNQGRLF